MVASVDRDLCRLTQTVFDADGPTDLRIEAEVDLGVGGAGEGPMLGLVRSGGVASATPGLA